MKILWSALQIGNDLKKKMNGKVMYNAKKKKINSSHSKSNKNKENPQRQKKFCPTERKTKMQLLRS